MPLPALPRLHPPAWAWAWAWPGRARASVRLAGLAALAALPGIALAQGAAAPFVGADLALGERLIAQHRCTECHVRKVGGNGMAIYRPQGRISRPAALLAMVERCNTELNLQLFPEDVEAVAAVLQRDHYRFK